MADNNELEIVLKVDDADVQKGKKSLQEVGEAGEKAATKTRSGFREAGKAIQDFKKEMFVLTATFGAVTLALNEWGKRNEYVRDTMQEIGLATSNVTSKLGEFIQKNTLLGAGFVFAGEAARRMNDSLNDTFTNSERAKNEIKNFNEELTQQRNQFIGGTLSAEEYFDALYTGQTNLINVRTQAAQQMQQLAQLTAEVNNQEVLSAQAKTQEQINLLNYYKQNFITAHEGMAAFTVTAGKAIQTNMSAALTSMITGAKSAKEAFSDLGKSMISAVVDFMVQKVIAWVLEKTLLAGTVAASIGAAATIAAAWAPAATLVSAATFGASAVAGAAGLTAAFATATGIATSGASAGLAGASGARIGTSDGAGGATTWGPVVPRATGGDDIVTKPTLFLAGEAGPERATFTPVGNGGGSGGEGITVNVFGGNFNSREMVRELAEQIGFEIERKLRGTRSFA